MQYYQFVFQYTLALEMSTYTFKLIAHCMATSNGSLLVGGFTDIGI